MAKPLTWVRFLVPPQKDFISTINMLSYFKIVYFVMPKVPEDPNVVIKQEFMREYYFPKKYHNYVSDCSLATRGKQYFIHVWLHNPLPKKLKLPTAYKKLKVKTEILKTR